MSDWRDTELGEVITLQRGFDVTEKEATPGPFPVISSRGPSYTIDVGKVPGPGVVTGRKGVLGKVHFSEGPYWPHDTTLWVKDFKGSDPRFVYYLLQTLPLASLDAGASNPTLNRNHAHLLPVRVPPSSTQERIGSILASIDELIENNQRRIEVLEEMARAIYREWFVRFQYPGHADVPLVESAFGPIPEGWAGIPLFDVAEVGFGFSFKSKYFADAGPFPVIRIRDVPNGTTKTYSEEVAPERYRVVDGDILIGMDGEFHLRQWTGGEAWLNQRVARLRPTNGLSARHLMLAITGAIRDWNAAISGTTVAHLGKRHLEQILVLVPAQQILDLATPLFDHLADQARTLAQASRRLASIRDLLLPKLVTGQIDVSRLDLDALTEAAIA